MDKTTTFPFMTAAQKRRAKCKNRVCTEFSALHGLHPELSDTAIINHLAEVYDYHPMTMRRWLQEANIIQQSNISKQ